MYSSEILFSAHLNLLSRVFTGTINYYYRCKC